MELNALMEAIREERKRLAWEGTFAEYFQMAIQNPALVRLAHQRIYDMIIAAGVEPDRWGRPQYRLFSVELFGLENTIREIVDYFHSSGRRFETRKRILLLLGPPGSGKSTLVNLIKRGLELYTRTDAGALYSIQDCPMQEEPLHLIPPQFRPEIERKHGLFIEGDLCPYCRWQVRHVYDDDIGAVKVRRVVLSEQNGIGIGTFVATDPGSRDLTRLTGSVDAEALTTDRLESFGRAYHLNGELNVANRGLMEFIEIFKLDERFLAVLLVLAEEQKIKAPGLGTIYADEAIVAHTNQAEYEALVGDKKSEALQDRLVVIRVPYNLGVSDEVRIYQKLLQEVDLKGTHIAPLTLRVAATLAVLSRLRPTQRARLSLVAKLKLYDGQYVEGLAGVDLEELRTEHPNEGMEGISPRFVVNQISRAVTREKLHCLDPLGLLQVMWEGIEQSSTLVREEKDRLFRLFADTRREYEEMAKREVQRAFVEGFEATGNNLALKYFQHVAADCTKQKVADPATGEAEEPNENFMRSMERAVGIQDYDRRNFRQRLYDRLQPLVESGTRLTYTLDGRLQAAVEKTLLPNLREVRQLLAPRNSLTAEALTRRDQVVERLVHEHGYCWEGALQLVGYVARLLSESAPERGRGTPKALQWLWR